MVVRVVSAVVCATVVNVLGSEGSAVTVVTRVEVAVIVTYSVSVAVGSGTTAVLVVPSLANV